MPNPINRSDTSSLRRATFALMAAAFTLGTLSGCGGGSGSAQTATPAPPPSTQPPPAPPPSQPSQATAYQIQLDQVSQAPLQSTQFSGQIQAQTPTGQTASSASYQITLN